MRLVVVLAVSILPAVAKAQGGNPQGGNPSFNLVNRSDQAINELYATPTGVGRWGQDRLARSLLPAGQTFPVRLPQGTNCFYDIRVIYADGRSAERRRANVCAVAQVVFPAD